MDLATQLLKSTKVCDKMRLITGSLQEEVVKLKNKASNLWQELVLA